MCGIVGIIDHKSSTQGALVEGMLEAIEHRGPDDAGVFVDLVGGVALGHRRLSVIDLSTGGHQPMSSVDGRLTVVFNGEIYNYLELKSFFKEKGLAFETNSDTEVLLRGYEFWGREVLNKLAGMFAFAIWDREEESLFLARDRVGKKPLVYYWDGNSFAFASEVKALMTLPACRRELDPQAVEAYLAFGYVPAPLNIFKRIKKLQPGHYLCLRKGRLEVARYWFPEKTANHMPTRVEERLEMFRALFQDAVRIRLRSDVPIGLFLSGGVDSSAVAAECVRAGQRLRGYTVAFDEDQTDLPFATRVAQHLEIEHEVIHTSGDRVREDLDRIVWLYDEPFGDSSNIPSYYISRAIKGQFKVILNGDGGDEAFGGYKHYEYIGQKQALKRFGALMHLWDGKASDPWQVYFQGKAIFRRGERERLVGYHAETKDGVTKLIGQNPFLRAYHPHDALHLALWGDRHIFLPNDLLYKMDIALMSQGIEGRSPFLDHRLMEWTQHLPTSDLLRGKDKKILLRTAFKGVLPSDILDRPKHGFGAPVKRWLCGAFSPLIKEYLPCPLFERNVQERYLEAFYRRPRTLESVRIWTLLFFAIWAKRWRATW